MQDQLHELTISRHWYLVSSAFCHAFQLMPRKEIHPETYPGGNILLFVKSHV